MEPSKFERWLDQFETAGRQMLSSQQRDRLVDSLLSFCDSHNLYRLSMCLEDLTRRDFLGNLPCEVSEQILCYLDWRSLLICRLVSRTWLSLVDGSTLAWRSAALDLGVDIEGEEMKAVSYRRLCRHACATIDRLKNGTAFDEVEMAECQAPITALHYFENKIITGADRYAQIWDCDSGEMLKKFLTHSIAEIRLTPDFFITASFDCTIAFWDRETGAQLKNFVGHVSAVFSLDYNLEKKLLVSGSADGSVKLWCIEREKLLQSLTPRSQLWVTQVTLCTSHAYRGYHVVALTTDINNNNVNYYQIWHLSSELSVLSQSFWNSSDPSILPGFLCNLDHIPTPYFLFGLSSAEASGCHGCTLILCEPPSSARSLGSAADGDQGLTASVGLSWFNTGSHYASQAKGSRNCCLLAAGTSFVLLGSDKPGHHGTVNVVKWKHRDIFDLPGCSALSQHHLPPRCRLSGRIAKYTVGETAWLSGMHPSNTKGVALAIVFGNKVHVLRWNRSLNDPSFV